MQVIKEGFGTKGPTLSTYISIPGRYLVLMPPINGATAYSGTPYFSATPGDPYTAPPPEAPWMNTASPAFASPRAKRATHAVT